VLDSIQTDGFADGAITECSEAQLGFRHVAVIEINGIEKRPVKFYTPEVGLPEPSAKKSGVNQVCISEPHLVQGRMGQIRRSQSDAF
jgi:hypothetical protein